MGNSNLKATDLDPDNFQGKSISKLSVVIGLARLHLLLLQSPLRTISFDTSMVILPIS